MKIRLCNRCKKEITVKANFIMCQEVSWDNRLMKVNRVGDLCLNCWENNINEIRS